MAKKNKNKKNTAAQKAEAAKQEEKKEITIDVSNDEQPSVNGVQLKDAKNETEDEKVVEADAEEKADISKKDDKSVDSDEAGETVEATEDEAIDSVEDDKSDNSDEVDKSADDDAAEEVADDSGNDESDDDNVDSKEDVKSSDDTSDKSVSDDKGEDTSDADDTDASSDNKLDDDNVDSKEDVKPSDDASDKPVSDDKSEEKPVLEFPEGKAPSVQDVDENGNVVSVHTTVVPEAESEQSLPDAPLTSRAKGYVIGAAVAGLVVGGLIVGGIMHATNGNKTLLTTSYGNITSAQVFNRIKTTEAAENAAQSLVMERVLEHDFPKAATTSKVDKTFNKIKKNKMSYMQYVQMYGSDDQIKSGIKQTLLLGAAMKASVKVSNADVRKAYKTYRPAMTLAYVQVKNKDRANQIHEQLAQSKDYNSFKEQAKDLAHGDAKNISAGLLPTISSLDNSQQVPSVVKNAAMSMKQGDVSKVLKVGDGTYAILYMKSDKRKQSYAQTKDELRGALKKQKMNDANERMKVLTKYAKKAHVKAKDSSYKQLAKMFNSKTPLGGGLQ